MNQKNILDIQGLHSPNMFLFQTACSLSYCRELDMLWQKSFNIHLNLSLFISTEIITQPCYLQLRYLELVDVGGSDDVILERSMFSAMQDLKYLVINGYNNLQLKSDVFHGNF